MALDRYYHAHEINAAVCDGHMKCMRVCPIATQAPLADPVRRFEAAQEEDGSEMAPDR